MSTARDTVISTPELLELILAQLPMRDLLLTAPLICKTWQAITLSPTVQCALFFQPDPQSEPVQNPLLVEMFPPFFAPEPEAQRRFWWPGQASSIKRMPWSKAPDAFRRKEASWRRMLVTQPPPQTMIVTVTCHGQGGDSVRRAELNDLSLRMGVLYDLAVPYIDRVASSFRIRWHHGLDLEDDLTLDTIYTQQCSSGGRRGTLDKQFYSDGSKPIKVNFGNAVFVPR
ncbi:hypothetical protein C8R44DRAFT_782988 [Mycena epipterygia]|nr:hypothetical protein C8R44DRAFT_782988 [Mycena epipterygia]